MKMKCFETTAVILVCCLIVDTWADNRSSSKDTYDDGIDDKKLEQEAMASVQEDIKLAEFDLNKGDTIVAEGKQALALSKQDVANTEIDKVNAEKDVLSGVLKSKTKPILGAGVSMEKSDAELKQESLQAASEMHDTAKEDKDVTGKGDLQNGLEDEKNAQKMIDSMKKMKETMP